MVPIQWALFSMDEFELSGLNFAAQTTKSLIIPLALFYRHINLSDAIAASRLEEEFQIEQYGEVEGHHDLDKVDVDVRLASASLFLHLLPPKLK